MYVSSSTYKTQPLQYMNAHISNCYSHTKLLEQRHPVVQEAVQHSSPIILEIHRRREVPGSSFCRFSSQVMYANETVTRLFRISFSPLRCEHTALPCSVEVAAAWRGHPCNVHTASPTLDTRSLC